MFSTVFSEPLDFTNAVWDDGEWVSWAEITHYAEAQEVVYDDELKPESSPEDAATQKKREMLRQQIAHAKKAQARSEDIGHLIGEMGELYVEARFRMKRHRRCAQGSDGKIGNDFVEVKTISPWKSKTKVRVKRAGHWSKLVVVSISEQWGFDARVVDRADISKGLGGKFATVSWQDD